MVHFFGLGKKAVSKMQAVILAVILIVVVVAGVGYYTVTRPPVLPAKDKIVIGAALSLSGPYAEGAGLHLIPYYNWVVDEVNAKGGLYVPEYGKRIPVELKLEDDKSDIETLLRLTEKLITEDKVDFLFTPWSTAFIYAASSLYEKYHYPMVLLTVGTEKIVRMIKDGESRYLFLTLGQPHHSGKVVADVLEDVGAKRVGIIFVSDLHGIEYAGALYTELSIRGGFEVPVYKSYPMFPTDLSPLIKELKDANVECLFAASYPPDGILLISQSRELGFNPKIMFLGPGIEVPGIVVPIFGTQALKGISYYDGYPATAYKTPELQAWAEEHKQRVGFYPFPASATFYAGLEALMQAIEEVGLDREKVRDELATGTFPTVLGNLRFVPGEHVNVSGTGFISQWQGGEMMEVVWPTEAASADIIYPKPAWP